MVMAAGEVSCLTWPGPAGAREYPARSGAGRQKNGRIHQGRFQPMSTQLQGKTIAFLVATDGIEQVELTEPWKAVEQAGGTPRLISTKSGQVQGRDHLEKADTFPVDATVDEVSVDDFDGLALPGGVANPDFLRTQEKAVAFVRGFFNAGKPVAAICHAPWTLVEADVVRGPTLPPWPSLKPDTRTAGAPWVDEEARVCTAGPHSRDQPQARRSQGLLLRDGRGLRLQLTKTRAGESG